MSILGLGRVAISGEETLGGRKGYIVQLESGPAGERELAGEWTIDPESSMPIAVRNHERGMVVSEILLEEYTRY